MLLAPLSSSSLGSAFISGFFSSVSIDSCFGSTASGSSFFTRRGLVSSFCFNTTVVNQLSYSVESQIHQARIAFNDEQETHRSDVFSEHNVVGL